VLLVRQAAQPKPAVVCMLFVLLLLLLPEVLQA
jgi:hypothetical protein